MIDVTVRDSTRVYTKGKLRLRISETIRRGNVFYNGSEFFKFFIQI